MWIIHFTKLGCILVGGYPYEMYCMCFPGIILITKFSLCLMFADSAFIIVIHHVFSWFDNQQIEVRWTPCPIAVKHLLMTSIVILSTCIGRSDVCTFTNYSLHSHEQIQLHETRTYIKNMQKLHITTLRSTPL